MYRRPHWVVCLAHCAGSVAPMQPSKEYAQWHIPVGIRHSARAGAQGIEILLKGVAQ